MKKSILFAALMCYIVSVSAQQPQNEPEALKSMKAKIQQVERLNRHENNFTVKLDSVTGDELRFLYEYDDRLNCTKEMRYYDDLLGETFENTYDEQNRLTSVTYFDNSYGSTTKKEEYTYNEQGLIVEAIDSYLLGNTWKPNRKRTFEYDEAGDLTLVVRFDYSDGWVESGKLIHEFENGLLQTDLYYSFNGDNGDWTLEYKTEYHYNAQGLCVEEVFGEWESEWHPSSKTEYVYNEQGLLSETIDYDYYYEGWWSQNRYLYEYDDAGNRLSKILFNHYNGSSEWSYTKKYEYSYDDHNNCTAYHEFYYYPEEWHFSYGYNMTYDPTVSIEQISGLDRFWDELEVDAPLYGKLQHLTMLESGDPDYPIDFHYSEYNSIDEPTENHLTVWPNPAMKTVHIEGVEAAKVQVYNALGQIVRVVQNSNEVNVSGLAEGVYLMRITDAKGKKHVARLAMKE